MRSCQRGRETKRGWIVREFKWIVDPNDNTAAHEFTPRQMISNLRQCARFIRDKTTAPEHIVKALYQAAIDLECWEDTHIHRLGDWPNRADIM